MSNYKVPKYMTTLVLFLACDYYALCPLDTANWEREYFNTTLLLYRYKSHAEVTSLFFVIGRKICQGQSWEMNPVFCLSFFLSCPEVLSLTVKPYGQIGNSLQSSLHRKGATDNLILH